MVSRWVDSTAALKVDWWAALTAEHSADCSVVLRADYLVAQMAESLAASKAAKWAEYWV